MTFFRKSGAASRFALAIALSAGAALTVSAPVQAAKKQEQPAAAEAKADFSKPFQAAYKPFYDVIKAKGDITTLKGNLPALQAAATTADDKYTAGQTTYNIGLKADDLAMQRQGVDLMIASNSNLVSAHDKAAQLYGAAQLAYKAKDWGTAISRAQQAVAAGYTGDSDMLIAEAYFAQDQAAPGVDALDKAIAKQIAAGQTPSEAMIKRGLAMAYNGNLAPQTAKLITQYVQYYPSAASWGDAINIQRNANDYDGQELVDLMRLAQRLGTLKTARDYNDYLNAADPRRMAGEVQRVIKAGIAAGVLKASDPFVSDANITSAGRVSADLADLPKLAAQARVAGATAITATAAADMYLSYDKPAEAEALYTLALTKPGVDSARALTRLGIAQVEQGKLAEAQANFAKVQGPRQPIAALWSLYAAQGAKPASAAPAAAPAQ